jgi:hypothetical protein
MSDNIDQAPALLDLVEPTESRLCKTHDDPQITEDVSVIMFDQDDNVFPFHESTTSIESSRIFPGDSTTSSDKNINIFKHLVTPQHRCNSLSTLIPLRRSDTLAHNTASDPSNIPQLPTELMIKIFKLAQHQDICLTSHLRTTKLNYSLVWPMIYKDKTIHLNRETLPGLATFMSIKLTVSKMDTPARKKELYLEKMEILERRKRLLASITTLVIDDVQVMLGWEWCYDLANFCSTIVLPNATKIIWREDKLREGGQAAPELIPGLQGGKWIKPPPEVSDYAIDAELPELQRRRLKQFIPVLPAKVKEVRIVVPGSGYFQDQGYQPPSLFTERPWFFPVSTIERIRKYVVKFTGDVTVRVHQPVSDSYIRLCPTRNTIYSFYSDYWDVPARTRLIDAFGITTARRLEGNYDDSSTWAHDLYPMLSDILSGTSKREVMLWSCKTAIGKPELFRLNGRNKKSGGYLKRWLLRVVTEMIAIIHSDHDEVKCKCCGTVGTSLKAWKTQVYT